MGAACGKGHKKDIIDDKLPYEAVKPEKEKIIDVKLDSNIADKPKINEELIIGCETSEVESKPPPSSAVKFAEKQQYIEPETHYVESVTVSDFAGFHVKDGDFYCGLNFQLVLGAKCAFCSKFIDGALVSAMGLMFHHRCFRCFKCRKEFLPGRHVMHNSDHQLFCENCINNKVKQLNTAKTCAGCSNPIEDEMYMIAMDKYWHDWCFKCHHCGTMIREYLICNDQIYCLTDFCSLKAKSCVVCSKKIVGLCLKLGEEYFHPACSRCMDCRYWFTVNEEMRVKGGDEVWHVDCEAAESKQYLDTEQVFSTIEESDTDFCRSESESIPNRYKKSSSLGNSIDRSNGQFFPRKPVPPVYAIKNASHYSGSYLDPKMKDDVWTYNSDTKSRSLSGSLHFSKSPLPSIQAEKLENGKADPPKSNSMSKIKKNVIPNGVNNLADQSIEEIKKRHKMKPVHRIDSENIFLPIAKCYYEKEKRQRMYERTQSLDNTVEKPEENSGAIKGSITETDIERCESGLGKLILKEAYTRQQSTPANDTLDAIIPENPVSASRTPNALYEPSLPTRYVLPYGASPSRIVGYFEPWLHNVSPLEGLHPYSWAEVAEHLRPNAHPKWHRSGLPPSMHAGSDSDSTLGDGFISDPEPSKMYSVPQRHSGLMSKTRSLDYRGALFHDNFLTYIQKIHNSSQQLLTSDDESAMPQKPRSKLVSNVIYPLSQLQTTNKQLPESVDRSKLEQHLSADEFLSTFNMDPEDFRRLPKWKRDTLKKLNYLF